MESGTESAFRQAEATDGIFPRFGFLAQFPESVARAGIGYGFARASSASLTNIFRNSPGPVTRSGKSSRKVLAPACRSSPSGSQPVQRQSATSAPSSLVA